MKAFAIYDWKLHRLYKGALFTRLKDTTFTLQWLNRNSPDYRARHAGRPRYTVIQGYFVMGRGTYGGDGGG